MSVWKQKANNTSGDDWPIPPAGSHPAYLVAIIDLGTHIDTFRGGGADNGKETKARKLFFVWELTDQPLGKGGGGNFTIGCDYTFSLGKKAKLRAMIERLKGKALGDDEEYDVSGLLGKPVMLDVVHKEAAGSGRTYARVEGVSRPHSSMKVPPARVKPVIWSLDDGGDPPEAPWIPYVRGTRVADMVATCLERKGGGARVTAGGGGGDEEAFGGGGSNADADEPIPY